MGPWPNSNEIQGSNPPYTLKDLPELAAKKLLTNYKPNNVLVSHITITQKYPTSKLAQKNEYPISKVLKKTFGIPGPSIRSVPKKGIKTLFRETFEQCINSSTHYPP